VRDCEVVITGLSDARIPWPRCRHLHTRSGPGLLIDDELARAVRLESPEAIKHRWGVGTNRSGGGGVCWVLPTRTTTRPGGRSWPQRRPAPKEPELRYQRASEVKTDIEAVGRPAAVAAGQASMPAEEVKQLVLKLLPYDKIGAIRAYRTVTGAGLTEAKEAVETTGRMHGIQPPGRSPASCCRWHSWHLPCSGYSSDGALSGQAENGQDQRLLFHWATPE
jgi:hypothetical protein